MHRMRREFGRISSSNFARNAGWLFLGQGLSVICQGGYFILLARLLGSTEYGIYVGAAATVSILSQYSPLGSHSVFLRYVSTEPEKFASYWGNILITTFMLGGLFVAFLTWAGPRLAHSFSWTLVLCVALGDCLCSQLTMAAGRVFQAFEAMRISASLNVLINMLRALLAGLMIRRLHCATAREWAVAALLVSSITACAAVTLVTKRFGRPRLSPRLLRQRAAEGFVFALSYSTTGIYNDIDKAMLGHYGMNAANGIYTMAYRAIDIACLPYSAIQSAAVPRFFQKGVNGVHSTAEYAIWIVKRTAPITLLATTAMLVATPLIPHLLGKSFSESVCALRWLCLLPVFRSFQYSAGDALTGAGQQKMRLASQATAAAFNFTTNLYLIPHYGWLGAAWASLATDGLLAIFNWMVLLRLKSKAESKTPPIAEVVC